MFVLQYRLSRLSNVFVKTLSGKTLVLQLSPNDTLNEVKLAIEVKEGVPPSLQRLLFCGKQLQYDKCLSGKVGEFPFK